MDEHPAPDPAKLLAQWMEWERGETPPGRVIANLKTGGIRDLLESLVVTGADVIGDPDPLSVEAASWTPIV